MEVQPLNHHQNLKNKKGQKGIGESANVSGIGQKEVGVIAELPVVLPCQQSKEKEFDEEEFKEKLTHMKNSRSSIDKIVKECLENKKADYKIIRCLERAIKKVDEKLTIFYVIHQLALKSSSEEHFQFNKRLGKLIVSLLPQIKDSVPLTKMKKCIVIWIKEKVFEKTIHVQLKRFDQKLDPVSGSTGPGTVESNCSQDGPVVTAQLNLVSSVVESPELSEPVKKLPRLDERLLREFQIDLSDNTPI